MVACQLRHFTSLILTNNHYTTIVGLTPRQMHARTLAMLSAINVHAIDHWLPRYCMLSA